MVHRRAPPGREQNSPADDRRHRLCTFGFDDERTGLIASNSRDMAMSQNPDAFVVVNRCDPFTKLRRKFRKNP